MTHYIKRNNFISNCTARDNAGWRSWVTGPGSLRLGGTTWILCRRPLIQRCQDDNSPQAGWLGGILIHRMLKMPETTISSLSKIWCNGVVLNFFGKNVGSKLPQNKFFPVNQNSQNATCPSRHTLSINPDPVNVESILTTTLAEAYTLLKALQWSSIMNVGYASHLWSPNESKALACVRVGIRLWSMMQLMILEIYPISHNGLQPEWECIPWHVP